jgi:hypothetical protein
VKGRSWRFGNVFLSAVLVLSVPMFFVVRHFEAAGVFDSIGTWYTVIVTAAFSAPLGLAVAAVVVLVRAAQTGPRVERH